MKTSFFVITLLSLLPLFTTAQDKRYVDSVTQLFLTSAADTVRAQAAFDLTSYYLESNHDASIRYADEAIRLSSQLNAPLSEALGKMLKAYGIYHQGNLLESYQLMTQALPVAEAGTHSLKQWFPRGGIFPGQIQDARLVLVPYAFIQMGHIQSSAGNEDKALAYYRQAAAMEMAPSAKADILSIVNSSMGGIFLGRMQFDSVEKYARAALQWAVLSSDSNGLAVVFTNLGEVAFSKRDLDSAKRYYWQSLAISKANRFIAFEIKTSLALAKLYERAGGQDSMHYYATKALEIANASKTLSFSSPAAALVAKAWSRRGVPDSAYKYMALSQQLADSTTRANQKRKAAFFSFLLDEQVRLQKLAQQNLEDRNRIRTISLVLGLAGLSALAIIFYFNNRKNQRAKRTVESALSRLKLTQSQLVQSEKMASLGELTAGIAHEIQNPLNFVNNFSEINNELIDELRVDKAKLTSDEYNELLTSIYQNNEKINHHGRRADAIVKGMLQHSRSSSGQKEPTNINALVDEYLRLAYHGLRAKDKSFNATLKTDYDDSIGSINIIPQDVGRVVLNLLTNAFYAVTEKKATTGESYEPTVALATKKTGDKVEIIVMDNGAGIPSSLREKIFQPFFTTKPTGQGTGLGLSMSYDIITKGHSGELKVESGESEGTAFTIILPA